MITVVGEALIDLVPDDRGRLDPRPGGAPRNVAVAAARLGGEVAYVGALGNDPFATTIGDGLAAEGVDLARAPRVELPTTLAVVHLDDQGRAEYGFYLEGTSAPALQPAHLDGALRGIVQVSCGALLPGVGTAGDALAAAVHGPGPTVLDPNVRAAFVPDRAAHAERFAELAGACDVVKVSDEDLGWLHPDEDPADVAARWHARGPAAVVLTRGPDGASVLRDGGWLDVAGVEVDVVDTVGAGDTFSGALLVALAERGIDDRSALDALDGDAWEQVLRLGVRAAAVTCTRVGADPPTRTEIS